MNEFRRTRNAMRTTGNLGQDALARWKAQGDITNFPMIRYQDKMENFRPFFFQHGRWFFPTYQGGDFKL